MMKSEFQGMISESRQYAETQKVKCRREEKPCLVRTGAAEGQGEDVLLTFWLTSRLDFLALNGLTWPWLVIK